MTNAPSCVALGIGLLTNTSFALAQAPNSKRSQQLDKNHSLGQERALYYVKGYRDETCAEPSPPRARSALRSVRKRGYGKSATVRSKPSLQRKQQPMPTAR